MVVSSLSAWNTWRQDGFTAGFYHSQWNIIKNHVHSLIHGLFVGLISLYSVNETLLTPIPKSKNPLHHLDWCPINFCNTFYKILSKIICNYLKPVMPTLIHPTQGPFMQGWGPLDNAYLIFEIFYSIFTRYKRLCHGNSVLAIKLDLAKAYDRLSLDFI